MLLFHTNNKPEAQGKAFSTLLPCVQFWLDFTVLETGMNEALQQPVIFGKKTLFLSKSQLTQQCCCTAVRVVQSVTARSENCELDEVNLL